MARQMNVGLNWSKRSLKKMIRKYSNGGGQSFGDVNAEAILPASWQQFYLAEEGRINLAFRITDIYAKYAQPRSQIITEMCVDLMGNSSFSYNEIICRLILTQFAQPATNAVTDAFLNAVIASASPKIERVEHVGDGVASEFVGLIGRINPFEPKNLNNGLGVSKPNYLTRGPSTGPFQVLAIRAGANGYKCTQSSYDRLFFTHEITTNNKNAVVTGNRIKFEKWPNFLFKIKE